MSVVPVPDPDDPAVADEGAADTAPPAKQLRIDGMPVAEEFVVLTGNIRVARAVVEKWKLGKPIELTVAAVIDSRKQKVIRNGTEATGELRQQVVLQVVDLVLDE